MSSTFGLSDEQRAKLRADHLDGIVHDLCIHILPGILGRDTIEPDGYLADDYGMDELDGVEIELECDKRWGVELDLSLGWFPNTIISVRDLAKAIQKAQDDACVAHERKAALSAATGTGEA